MIVWLDIWLLFFLNLILQSSKPGEASCSWEGIQLYGRVQVVEHFPDLKVQVVTSFPELKVESVEYFPDSCGKWQFVEQFPDFKIQYVEHFPDLEIQFVQSFSGLP